MHTHVHTHTQAHTHTHTHTHTQAHTYSDIYSSPKGVIHVSGMHVTSPCRALVEGRDAACIERDRAVQGEKDAVRKYEELLSR